MLFQVKYVEKDGTVKQLVVSENNIMLKDDMLFLMEVSSRNNEWEELDILTDSEIEFIPITESKKIKVTTEITM